MNMPKRVWDTNKQHFSCFELLSRVCVQFSLAQSSCALVLNFQKTVIALFHLGSLVKMSPEVCILCL